MHGAIISVRERSCNEALKWCASLSTFPSNGDNSFICEIKWKNCMRFTWFSQLRENWGIEFILRSATINEKMQQNNGAWMQTETSIESVSLIKFARRIKNKSEKEWRKATDKWRLLTERPCQSFMFMFELNGVQMNWCEFFSPISSHPLRWDLGSRLTANALKSIESVSPSICNVIFAIIEIATETIRYRASNCEFCVDIRTWNLFDNPT